MWIIIQKNFVLTLKKSILELAVKRSRILRQN